MAFSYHSYQTVKIIICKLGRFCSTATGEEMCFTSDEHVSI